MDPERAPVGAPQLNAAKSMLLVAGVLRQGSGSGQAPLAAVQVNVGASPHDIAAALSANPDALDAAIDAGRIMSGAVTVSGSDPT